MHAVKSLRSKSRLSVLALMLVFMVILAACGNTASTTNNTATSNTTSSKDDAASAPSSSPSNATAKKPVEIVWWHAMGGELGKAVDALVDAFNKSQNDVVVKAVFQGNYDEELNKLKASLGTKNAPTLVQVYEIGSRFMIDSGAIEPMQTWIDRDHFDISHLEPNILGYYTFDGKLYSMPFNTSNPILYYNKDMFRAAGLDPEKPPRTYEEFTTVAQQLTKNGVSGASFAIYGWFMEQFFAESGAELVNNGNGRDGLATESLLNSEAGVNTLTWWKQMVDNKSMLNLGRKTDDTRQAFGAGKVAMILDSTASLRGIVSGVGDKFEVGTGFLPHPQAVTDGGVIVGGASLWMLKEKSEEEKSAAWQFIKFLTSPEIQAQWHVSTGYFPITTKAYDVAIVKENMTKYPQFRTAVDQLHATPLNNATKGAVMGVFPEARQITERAMEEAINGQKSVKDALDQAANEITQKIQQYNRSIGK
ncbi:MAG: ABC transporter substrate-binding protein [Candidatus Carbobacillus sp.]|nr:ABC transporter substrate-binding protein [Candidatus Carbobacillus sp.]